MARGWRTIAMGLAGAALLGAAPVDPELADALLHAAPLLSLLGLLIAGRYLGAGTIMRLAARNEARPRAAAPPLPPLRAVSRALARGGALLGAALAVRPPPAAAPALR
jgi:hypothetical protein